MALSGPPGVGKSVLLGALAEHFEGQGFPVSVLAVDPTSPTSGGALLGDRVRFDRDRGEIFWRSMAARDGREGLSPEAAAALRLMAAGGFRRLLIETAGVGQGDTRVRDLADITVAVTAPGLGDAVQAAKAGLFEVADLIVVNQADRPGAEATVSDWRSMRSPESILTTIATEGKGVGELARTIEGMLAARPAKDRSSGREPETEGPLALRLHHVGIATRDSEADTALWGELFGLRLLETHEVPEFSVVARFLAAGEEEPDPGGQLELVEPRSASSPASSPVERFLERRGPGLHHLCFEVRDIRRAIERLRELGVRMLDEEPRLGAGGRLVAFLHPKSAGGVLVELRQAGGRCRT